MRNATMIGLTLPVVIGISAVVVTYLVMFFFKRSTPKLLEDPEKKYSVPLVSKEIVSHDTRLFRFGLPSKKHRLGLPVGQHVYLSAKVNEEMVIRPYTPVSSDDELGHFDLVIKVYFKGVHPKFPDGGKMTQHLESLKIGDTIDIRGPSGLLEYQGSGTFAIRPNKKSPPEKVVAKRVGMIAGGTGLTPMYQLIKEVFKNSSDKTQLALLYANQTEDDILMRKELEKFQADHPEQFKLYYTLDRPTDGWKYGKGFVTSEMIDQNLFPPSDDTLILMCGPPPMVKFACQPNLEKLGHSAKMRFAY